MKALLGIWGAPETQTPSTKILNPVLPSSSVYVMVNSQ